MFSINLSKILIIKLTYISIIKPLLWPKPIEFQKKHESLNSSSSKLRGRHPIQSATVAVRDLNSILESGFAELMNTALSVDHIFYIQKSYCASLQWLIITTLVNQVVSVKVSVEEKYNYYSNCRLYSLFLKMRSYFF